MSIMGRIGVESWHERRPVGCREVQGPGLEVVRRPEPQLHPSPRFIGRHLEIPFPGGQEDAGRGVLHRDRESIEKERGDPDDRDAGSRRIVSAGTVRRGELHVEVTAAGEGGPPPYRPRSIAPVLEHRSRRQPRGRKRDGAAAGGHRPNVECDRRNLLDPLDDRRHNRHVHLDVVAQLAAKNGEAPFARLIERHPE